MKEFLGVDTSNYTTSVSRSTEYEIADNIRIMLKVEQGQRGLRQSDAVFQHTLNLPKAFEMLGKISPTAVGVSATPRDVEGSYMPCFLSGVACACAVASSFGVPLYRFSHQAGHIASALYSCGREDLHEKRFIAFHVSGGTTEITLFDKGSMTLLGGTKDISCGKAIDRIGVKLGLSFPCGKALSEISCDPDTIKSGKINVEGLCFNLSGLENKTDEMMKKGSPDNEIAGYVFSHIGAVLERLTENALSIYGDIPVLYAGGVMSNVFLRKRLQNKFNGLFAEADFSCDNASGISRLTMMKHEGMYCYA